MGLGREAEAAGVMGSAPEAEAAVKGKAHDSKVAASPAVSKPFSGCKRNAGCVEINIPAGSLLYPGPCGHGIDAPQRGVHAAL